MTAIRVKALRDITALIGLLEDANFTLEASSLEVNLPGTAGYGTVVRSVNIVKDEYSHWGLEL
jgi:hypothetical protein